MIIFRKNNGQIPGFGLKTFMGVAAGAIGAFVGTPAEVALVRMTADGRLPVDQRRNYKNVADALLRYVSMFANTMDLLQLSILIFIMLHLEI